MIITNKYNLPESFVSFCKDNSKPKENTIRVTELISPPRIRALRKENWDKIEEDVADKIWALLGTSVHYILEEHTNKDDFSEEKLELQIGKWTLKGRPDLLSKEGTLSDYKVTSVWSYIFGDKPEWEEQLNVYAYMYSQFPKKFPKVSNLEIIAIFRDWSLRDSLKNTDYPQIPCARINIPLWDIAIAEEFIHYRLSCHSASEISLPLCTSKERWEKKTTYAVKKQGMERALRVFDTSDEAYTFLKAYPDKKVSLVSEIRKGESVRCKSYCNCLPFCEQGQSYVV